MKKLIALLLAFTMVFSLVACVQDAPSNEDDDEEEEIEETEKEETFPITYKFKLFGGENALKLEDEENFVITTVSRELTEEDLEDMDVENLDVKARFLQRIGGKYRQEGDTLTLELETMHYVMEVIGESKQEAIEKMIEFYEDQDLPYDDFAQDLFTKDGADMTEYVGSEKPIYVVELENGKMVSLLMQDSEGKPNLEYQLDKNGKIQKQIRYEDGEPSYYWAYDEEGEVIEEGSLVQDEVVPDTPEDENPNLPDDETPNPPDQEDVPDVAVQEYDITIWASDYIVDQLNAQITEFNNTNEYGIRFNFYIEGVSESDAAHCMLADVAYGADLYCFAQDQAGRLMAGNALSALDPSAMQWVYTTMNEGSVRGVEMESRLWGYPMTSDNGYFMYYDKSVISETDAEELEALIAACEVAGKKFAFELENAWYMASFFFATGCVTNWTIDENGDFVGVEDTFNSAAGLAAARGMKKLLHSSCYLNSSDAYAFHSDAAVLISGIWNYETIKSILGDNMGVADLPSFVVDGQSYHLGSFAGCKYMGVKPQEDADKEAALHLLAQYLTSEACQQERFDAFGWGPACVNLQYSDAVQAHPAMVALLEQNRFAVPQGQIHGQWWDFARQITSDILQGTDPQTALDNYQQALEQIFGAPVESGWSVIGTLDGTAWDYDFPMIELSDGIWRSEQAFTMDTSTEFKIRLNGSWDVNYGADGVQDGSNICPVESGTFYVVFDSYTGDIWLEAAE